jgi:SAM-dependent methyltransferase/glycosyltransferase involved in cell wall biosynthesis
MTESKLPVNSKEYWEARFRLDWGHSGGPSQTTFFAETTMRLLPSWLTADLAAARWRFADVGCAEGEGAALFKSRFQNMDVHGFDFSEAAIETARLRHSEVVFHADDLTAMGEIFDVVFCSNVLEHFRDPGAMLARMAEHSREYLIIAVPGWEFSRHPEHHVTFTLSDVPASIAGMSIAHLAAVNCAELDRDQWPGYQMLIVFASPNAMQRAGVTSADIATAAAFSSLRAADIEELAMFEPAMALQASRTTPAIGRLESLVEGVAAKVQSVSERNEVIAFNTRVEIRDELRVFQADITSQMAELLSLSSAIHDGENARNEQVSQLLHELSLKTEVMIEMEKALEALGLQLAAFQNARSDEASRLLHELSLKSKVMIEMEKALEALSQQLGAVENARSDEASRLLLELSRREKTMSEMEKTLEALSQQLGALGREVETLRQSRDSEISTLRSECASLKAALAVVDEDRAGFVRASDRYYRHLEELRSSTSWRVSAPLRWVRTALMGGQVGAMPIPPPIPVPIGPLLSRAARAEVVVPEMVGRGARPLSQSALDPAPDLTWEEFAAQILSQRSSYRGIFVQEVVIDWNVPLYQRPQHIASALGRLGYLVIYKTVNWTNDDVTGFRQVATNVWLTNSPMVDSLDHVVRSVYSTAYADDPDRLTRRSANSVMAYEYIDHIDPQISGDPANIERLLRLKNWAFSGGAHVVIASARALEAEAVAAVGRERTILVQNGVDTRHYRDPVQTTVEVPPALLQFREEYKVVVGYFGAIAPWLWYDAVNELVASRPDIGFVFIGPDYYGGVEKLPQSKNALYLGTVDYRVLPGHARHFDVCFIPFEPGEIAKTTSPLKLFEYFALEKPVVVTTDMLECVAHPEVFRGRSAAEFSAAIDSAVAIKDKLEFRHRLAELADQNDWDRRAEAFAKAFDLLRP